MKLWFRRIAEHEEQRLHSEHRPSEEWFEVERELEDGETVEIVDEQATIVSAPTNPAVDPRSRAIVRALPDILLAVVDGADLRDELQKVIRKAEVPSGER
jgi:hypothetical protein